MTEHLGFYVSDVARLMRKRYDAAARRDGVTGAQWRVLIAVAKYPGINQSQLAERLEVEPITVCRMIDRMEQAGLVERRPDPQDRRARRLYAAERARGLIDQLQAHGSRMLDLATHDLTDSEQDLLMALLERVRANLLDDSLFALTEHEHG